jgi:hypothetical protein
VERLREKGAVLAFKSSGDAPPLGSSLSPGAFVLILQNEYQRKMFNEHGNKFSGIDATHNTTQYENVSLFTVIVRDRWGHGA